MCRSFRCRHVLLGFLLVVVFTLGCRRSVPPAISPPKQSASDGNPEDDGYNSVSFRAPSNELISEYVDDQTCSDCHAEIADRYAQHAMGRSAALLDSNSTFPPASQSSFQADGFHYEMKLESSQWLHHQLRDGDESGVASVVLPVSHVIGSGKNGQSFLVDRGGHLFMSPVTWYPAKGVWDLSPGYEKNNSQFNRPVIEECLYCHTDGAKAVAHTINRYEEPPLRGHVIGCQRCHGPGQQHVATMQADDGAAEDLRIVNPAKLAPEQREAVCQQCHLSGVARVLKPGRKLNDFQPGQSLHTAYTIFTLPEDGKEFVGHVEQMYSSRCFEGSQGQLGCISCHDPHFLPSPAEKLNYYRDRCLQCHGESDRKSQSADETQTPCALDLDARLAASSEDNCVQCHMPQRPTEVRHAAVTDHTIRRQASSELAADESLRQLAAFPNPSAATPRDKAIAFVNLSSRRPELLSGAVRETVLHSLEQAVSANPDDFDAADALAAMYLEAGRVQDALDGCRRVLAAVPDRETTLQLVCETYSQTGQHQKAVSHWEQLLGVNPWMSNYWYQLGRAYAALERWQRCQQLAAEGKKRFPTSMGLRHLLVECYLQLGERELAEAEFREIEAFAPPKLDSLQQWYREHPKRK